MSAVRFERVVRRYGCGVALDGVDLTVEAGSLTVLCGPSGSGKSVLLRLLVGLETPDAGRILIDGDDITAWPAARRRIGYVPQSFALFPHMSVRRNIAYPLGQRGVAASEIDARIGRVAEILRITALLEKRPSQLSGGEKQRVAIARGTIQDASVFALDDPLVGLDFKLRESLMDDLKDMRAALSATFLYVTSDSLEALTMAEQLAVLDAGHLVEAGAVERIYHEPQRLRSAELIGFPRCNIVPGRLDGTRCINGLAPFAFEGDAGREVSVAIRPEHVVFMPGAPEAGDINGTGRISLMENLGAECVVYFEAGGITLVSAPSSEMASHLSVGGPFAYRIRPETMLVFEPGSGARLGVGKVAAYA